MQNNDISKLMNMKRPDISPAVFNLLQHSQLQHWFCKKKFFHAAKTVSQQQKLCSRKYITVHDFTSNFLRLMIAKLTAYV